LPLATNFRSQPGVIEFVNALFAPEFGAHYQPLHAARAAASDANVEFLWTTRSDGPQGNDAGKADANRKAEALTIAARLRELIDSEQPLVVDADTKHLRAVRPGDVAILFRAFSNVHLYEQALRAAELPFYTVAGRAFYSQQEVYDVLHLLRAVTSTCDDIALAGVLRSPFFGLRDETLLAISELEGNLNAGLARGRLDRIAEPLDRERAELGREVLRELRHAAPRLSTPALLELAFARTGYDAALLAEFLGERKLANVRKLVEQARRSDAAGGSLATFIRQLGEFTAREPKEAQAATVSSADDVVRLMTIHGSKGLEFPVVVVADLESPKQARPDAVVFSPTLGPLVKGDHDASVGLNLHNAVEKQAELAETLRLFYVACTRAADHLILSGTLADPDKPKGPFTQVLARQFDIQSGRQRSEAPVLAPIPTSFTPRTMAELDIKQPRSVKLNEALEKLRDSAPQALPSSAFPLPINVRSQRAFSVSRLTGKLWRRSEFAARKVTLPAAGHVDARGLGTLVHAVLERLTLRGTEDVAAWCDRLAPLHVNRSVDETAALATQLLTRFVASSRYQTLAAAPQVEREVEFLLAWPSDAPEPHAQLSGSIDGAYLLPDGRWQIVDYKTNQVTAAEVPSEAKKYELQLAVYALALEAATGEPPAGMTLHFLRPGVEIEFVWNPAAKRAALVTIESAIAATRAAEENAP
jgi:ATP-dependent helicase/nuclease subunit A